MVASTVNQDRVNDKNFYRRVQRITREMTGGDVANPDGRLIYFDITSDTIATTSVDEQDDETFVFTFPVGAHLESLRIDPEDLDSHATPTLEINTIVEDSSGTETVLIAGAGGTTWETGSSDELDANISEASRSVGGKKLGFKVVTAAATAVAGTVRVSGSFWMGSGITF